MTDDKEQEVELELEPLADDAGTGEESSPADASATEPSDAVAAGEAGDATPGDAPAPEDDGAMRGQWVWQYAAPPPPPAWSAAFFSGTALKELYRFFACGLLVVIGGLLPWGPQMVDVPNDPMAIVEGGPELVGEALMPPALVGYETPSGVICLVIGLWLMLSAGYGIYTSRQKILPVFLMIEPAFVSWMRTLDAWDQLDPSAGMLQNIQDLFMVAGTGVMLTLIGSTFVALNFFLVVGKVYTKKDDKGAARKSARGGKAKGGGKAKAGDEAKVGDEGDKGESKAEGDGAESKDKAGGKGRRGRKR